ncbi:hypothetical protein FM076_09455 [Streptomyces albus subsp. chlorinus]|uniref:hypothetical protein n=1 Tax=Streptomyces albus TaxID=1888 RepID=UPI00156E4650|nr:hypothetical protein [Streptomyces albus]NSC21421.1 hypothetical protein [Streptomyces albus subsp. chlorinus]
MRLLDPDPIRVTDGGGEVLAGREPVTGGRRVAELLPRVGSRCRLQGPEPVEAGGEPALPYRREGAVRSADTRRLRGGRIVACWRQLAPSELAHI